MSLPASLKKPSDTANCKFKKIKAMKVMFHLDTNRATNMSSQKLESSSALVENILEKLTVISNTKIGLTKLQSLSRNEQSTGSVP